MSLCFSFDLVSLSRLPRRAAAAMSRAAKPFGSSRSGLFLTGGGGSRYFKVISLITASEESYDHQPSERRLQKPSVLTAASSTLESSQLTFLSSASHLVSSRTLISVNFPSGEQSERFSCSPAHRNSRNRAAVRCDPVSKETVCSEQLRPLRARTRARQAGGHRLSLS